MAGPITLEMVVAFIVIMSAIGGVWWRIEASRQADARAAHAARAKIVDELRELQRDLFAYKLFVAQNHVPVTLLKDTENRLISAIEKVAVRLETIVSRMEKWREV